MDNEISLVDIFNTLKEGKGWLAAAVIAGALLGAAYAFQKPAKYEARADIQMASVAGTMVEVPNILVEKLKLPGYYSTTTVNACGLEKQPTAGQTLATALKPTANKNAPFITVSYKSSTAEGATACIESVLKDIRTGQNILAKPIIESKKGELSTLQQKLEASERMMKFLTPKYAKFDFNDTKFSAAALVFFTLTSKETEVRTLANDISNLKRAMQEPQTMETHLVTPIYAPGVALESSKKLTILLAALACGLLTAAFLVVKHALKQTKK